ncbi:filamentous hemagglutinin N-terminal domain-containing protein [Aetokthonos hydrillicola CCALA 1050]|nr:filamentous hemagglutinin N-terminal domain-containing protein [Aetokthonos hydrillicola CCALA 1050]
MGTRWHCLLKMIIGGAYAFSANSANAQITPDRTLPNNSNVTLNNRIFNISGGTTAGRNLFHSFQQFSVPTNTTAFFNNALNIQNVISRVTGGSISNIDGVLRTNGKANLFLINPNGIIFGVNARLNVGSFVASTASSINFADGKKFSATASQTTPLLSINVPTGLQFGDNPGRILVQGNGRGLRNANSAIIDTNIGLRVDPNQTLALVGGDVTFEGGTLKTAGGRIELGSVGEPGVVSLTPINKGFSLGYENISSFKDIQLSRATAVDASGESGGDIQVQSRQLTVTGGSQIQATTLRSGTGGTLTVSASQMVQVSGSTADNPGDNRSNPSSLSTDNREGGQIRGQLTVNTRRLLVENGARISASNTTNGSGGNININASENVQLIGTGISPGGLRSSGLSVQTRGSGNAGNLTINTKQLMIQNGAEVSASTFGTGNGGNVTVNASDSIEVSGASTTGELRSRLVAEVGDPADVLRSPSSAPLISTTGKGGNLTVNTRQLTVNNGGAIAVSSRTNAQDAQGAGSLKITAQTTHLNNQGTISAETFSGEGGDITLQVNNFLLLRNHSEISSTAGSAGLAGNGGNININTPFILAIPGENSDITANAFNGSGGKINITTTGIFGISPLSLQDLERLRPGDLDPRQLPTNDITAVSQQNPSLSGQVNVNTPDIDPSRGLVTFPTIAEDTPELVSSSCSAFNEIAGGSSFIITGRGGLPPTPYDPLTGDAVWTDTRLLGNTTPQRQPITNTAKPELNTKSSAIIPATGWVFNGKGEVTLISSVTNATNSGSASGSCPTR